MNRQGSEAALELRVQPGNRIFEGMRESDPKSINQSIIVLETFLDRRISDIELVLQNLYFNNELMRRALRAAAWPMTGEDKDEKSCCDF